VVPPPTALARGGAAENSESIRLLYVGGYSVLKGGGHLLTLLVRARDRGIPVQATVVGSPSPFEISHPVDYPYFRERIEQENLRDKIAFHTRVNRVDLEPFYAKCDWLFHHSRIDGSPRAVLESLVRGLPVVASRHPGVEVLDPEEEFILFSDPFDPDSVLDVLVSHKADPKAHEARSKAGQKHVIGAFSSEAVSARYVDLYAQLLAERFTR